LGAGDEDGATAYGRDIIRLSALVYVLASAAVVAAATPIAQVFVDDPTAIAATAAFVIVAAVSAVPLGVNGSITGSLRGAGDTRWPFFAAMLGLYVFALPAALFGTVTALGVGGLYVAVLVEKFVPMGVNLIRFRSDRWQAVSRQYRPGETESEGAGG